MWGFPIKGHDFFIQVTDARADTGGLSGATPSEAVSWNKIDPAMLPRSIVCYSDNTIVMPMVVSYLLQKNTIREKKNLFKKIPDLLNRMKKDFLSENAVPSPKPGVNETVRMLKQVNKKLSA
jgi:deoxyhypusine synthase